MYDAIVVGARVAGAPTAMLLARAGFRVLLVDRATFPSDTLSTHFLQFSGALQLHRWGLLERLAATGCPPIRTTVLDVAPGMALPAPVPNIDGVDATFCPRRTVLDKLLVDAAVVAGVELREAFTVQEVLIEDGRVVGIRGRERGGDEVEERARVVIGADGARSRVAQAVAAEEYNVRPALSCGYYSYWSGVPVEAATIFVRSNRIIFAFPTHNDQTCVAMEWPNAEFHSFRADIEGHFMRTLELVPRLAAQVRAGTRMERFVGTGSLPNYFRRSYGPGWVLVGDAGYHKDPVTGSGIADAFRDAQLLADALRAGFTGTAPLEDALAERQRLRDETGLPNYELACRLASFEPPTPETLGLFGVAAGRALAGVR